MQPRVHPHLCQKKLGPAYALEVSAFLFLEMPCSSLGNLLLTLIMSCSLHTHSPFSLREHTFSKQEKGLASNPNLSCCLCLIHAHLGEAVRRGPSDSAGRCWLAPHPSGSKDRIQTIFSSRRKGNWVICKHWEAGS